eukprot:c19410_g1_i3.p1 GENE.c19410_g1_i3~~c19410_g1_i3.p1  ORF type:complete len:503 (+),score=122.87 c19410_g1_i3:43-1551(+)
MSSEFGLYGLAVMGQNFALNVAEKGFKIAVCNRSPDKVEDCVNRAKQELGDAASNLTGYTDPKEFVAGLSRPRKIMFLVKAGSPVDACIALFSEILDPGDILIDGGNEWYLNSIRRAEELKPKGILYMAMGISGGEEGARNGPSLMPGGPKSGFDAIHHIIQKVSAQTDTGPCTTYIGGAGSGNYVKMVHNGIEYGDMQLISEAAEILRTIGGLDNSDLAEVFAQWNEGKLQSFLIEITSKILAKKDEDVYTRDVPPVKIKGQPGMSLVDLIVDRTANKGTGKMTVQEGAEKSVAVSTMSAALDMRFTSYDKANRVAMSKLLEPRVLNIGEINKQQLINDVETALYCSKICSYAQGMNLIREANRENNWGVNLGECARIWKGGCIIRAKFLDAIKQAYDRDPSLPSLLVDSYFMDHIIEGQFSWRRVVSLCARAGVSAPSMFASLSYFDSYRAPELYTSQIVQAQRDFFGSHTFERKNERKRGGAPGKAYHCAWTEQHAIAK